MKLETAQISKIFKDKFSDRVLRILELTDKGFVNDVYVVETDQSRFIFRTGNENSLDEYEKEKWAATKASENRVPTPNILETGVFENQAYSIQAYVEGAEGRCLAGERLFIWRKLGEYAKQIHRVKVGGCGLAFRDMTAGSSQNLWLKYLDYNIESLNERDELLKLGVITRAQSHTIRENFENLRTREFRFGLNHGDLSLKNTIIDRDETVHLIDWGSAEASIVPHHDLIQLLKMNLLENSPNDFELRAFCEGCKITAEEFNKMMPDLRVLLILRAFDKLRWAIDRKLANLHDYVTEAIMTVKKYQLNNEYEKQN